MRLLFLSTLIGFLFTCGTAFAQPAEDAQNAANSEPSQTIQVQINQPFVTKSLGNLTLPFMWDAQEIEGQKRVVVTETRTHAPAVLTIDLLPLPKDVEVSAIAGGMIQAAAKQLGVTAPEVKKKDEVFEDEKKKKQKVTFYQADFKGTENQVERRCALNLLPIQNNSNMLVFTICAAATQTYQPDLPEILSQVFSNMN